MPIILSYSLCSKAAVIGDNLVSGVRSHYPDIPEQVAVAQIASWLARDEPQDIQGLGTVYARGQFRGIFIVGSPVEASLSRWMLLIASRASRSNHSPGDMLSKGI